MDTGPEYPFQLREKYRPKLSSSRSPIATEPSYSRPPTTEPPNVCSSDEEEWIRKNRCLQAIYHALYRKHWWKIWQYGTIALPIVLIVNLLPPSNYIPVQLQPRSWNHTFMLTVWYKPLFVLPTQLYSACCTLLSVIFIATLLLLTPLVQLFPTPALLHHRCQPSHVFYIIYNVLDLSFSILRYAFCSFAGVSDAFWLLNVLLNSPCWTRLSQLTLWYRSISALGTS